MRKYIGMIEVNESVIYIELCEEKNKFFAGTATNCGMSDQYSMEYDKYFSMDENLQEFIEIIENGELSWKI